MRAHLATLLEDFRRFGSGRAVVRHTGNRRKSTSYEDIARFAGRFAALLDERGILRGDRVMIWAENSAHWISAFYGCMLRGVLAVPLDVYGTVEFATRVASDVRPSLVVGDLEFLRSLNGEWSKLAFEDWLDVLPAKEIMAAADLSRETPLQILFTSGTTGDPKGIVHTHGNVLASLEPIEQAARGYMRYERLIHPLRFLHTLPLSHVFGQMMGLWVPAIFAAEVHFENRLVPSRLIETIHEERISVVAAVPRVLAMLKNHLEAEDPSLPVRLAAMEGKSALRRWWYFRALHSAFGWKFWAFVTGGSAFPISIERFWTTLSFVVVQGYGMTETAALITLNHPFDISGGSMGKPLPGREIKVESDGEVLVRGPMVSSATWSGGSLRQRQSEWLATGDLARVQPDGALRFLGRKSETIVTGSGVNLHPEDLEGAFEQESEVRACAVVPMETSAGSEPCVVLVLRGSNARADTILQRANARLAEFQRIHRYVLWPDPDLPRTSTGKVKRAEITAWLANQGVKIGKKEEIGNEDWLLKLIAHITGENPPAERENDLRLTEDLHLDSLGRVQLFSALEQRLGLPVDEMELSKVETLQQLRQLVMPSGGVNPEFHGATKRARKVQDTEDIRETRPLPKPSSPMHYVYPRWPWSWPLRWIRNVFLEIVVRPLVWLLAAPRVMQSPLLQMLAANETMLVVANHVTTYDVPLLLFALPRSIRTRTAVAMAGEMLEDFRHARHQGSHRPNPTGPITWLLLSTLFNVFPLPRYRDFQRSFDHMGRALDRGFHILLFPEGRRSPDGTLANFRRGIGLLVKQSSAPVLPVALCGLGELKMGRRGWFRSGHIEIHVGEPLYFGANESEITITERLQLAIQELLAA